MTQQRALSRIREYDRAGRLNHECCARALAILDHTYAHKPSTETTFERIVRPANE